MPLDQDYEDAKIPVKDSIAEENAIRDIAYAVESYFIAGQINTSNDIMVKMRENLEYEKVFLEEQEKDWIKVRWMS